MVVLTAGTGGTVTGIGRKIREKCPDCKVNTRDAPDIRPAGYPAFGIVSGASLVNTEQTTTIPPPTPLPLRFEN
jgi:cysteine synthase